MMKVATLLLQQYCTLLTETPREQRALVKQAALRALDIIIVHEKALQHDTTWCQHMQNIIASTPIDNQGLTTLASYQKM